MHQFKQGITAASHNRYLVVTALFGASVFIYYMGDLFRLAGLEALNISIWNTVHDVHRLVFLVPIVYSARYLPFRITLAVLGATLVSFLPRAIFLSPYPHALGRSLLSIMLMGGAVLFLRRLVLIGQQNAGRSDTASPTLRRPNGNGEYLINDLYVDIPRRVAKKKGRALRLTPTEFRLLEYLIRNHGKAVSHEELLYSVWGREYRQESEYLRTFVSQLRRKIENDPSNPELITTERQFGYRFIDLSGEHD